MELQNYVDQAVQTESVPEELNLNKDLMVRLLGIFIATSELLDQVKKHTFYNKRINVEKFKEDMDKVSYNLQMAATKGQIDSRKEGLDWDEQHNRILHGLLGMITESGELGAILLAMLRGEEIDMVNLGEELGDSDWYHAITCDASGLSWDEVLLKNNEKLLTGAKARYKSGNFTKDEAINRDVDAERQQLESTSVEFPATEHIAEANDG